MGSQVRTSGGGIETPPGVVSPFAGASAPAGYLLCYGQMVAVADYPDLFAAIGFTYGNDADVDFGIPDMRGRTPVGVGGAAFTALGVIVGEETHVLDVTEAPTLAGSMGATTGTDLTPVSGYGSNGAAHNNIQPSTVLNYIIKT